MNVPCEVKAQKRNPDPNKLHLALATYTDHLHKSETQLKAAQSKRRHVLVAVIICLSLFLATVTLSLFYAVFPAGLSILAGLGTLYLYLQYGRIGERWKQAALQCEYFTDGIARMTGNWQGKGDTGLAFAREDHLYQIDLNVLGKGSLFELLCTTRSKAGAERLASYLLDSVDAKESRLRQEAVKELRDATVLRQKINMLGKHRLQDCDGHDYREWLDLPSITVPRLIPAFLLLSSLLSGVLAVGIFAKVFLWMHWLPLLGFLIVMQTGIAGLLLRQVRPQIQKLCLLTDAFTLLQQGLGLMQRQNFNSVKLQALLRRVSERNATLQIKRLERLVRAFEQREKPYFLYPSRLLAIGTQLVLAIDRWRAKYQGDFNGWLDAWAEFEALNAIAGYAFEQPDCIFPELVEGELIFNAKQLGHPLLAAGRCVGNDVMLDRQSSRFYLVSGSNMAGKSTFLRAIGLNAVLAFAGGPVRAASLRLAPFAVCASLAIGDSLMDGKSKFLCEVERIEKLIGRAQMGRPVLFLIDEILSGTNSSDRRVVAEIVVKALLAQGAVGALSTHDLALAEITRSTDGGVLVCMESSSPDDPLNFDYRIKPGISRQSSALAIARMMGLFQYCTQ